MRQPLTPEALAGLLVGLVEGTTGIKGVDLVAALAVRCVDEGFAIPTEEVGDALARLVADGRLVEVEYAVPEMPKRAKSFYLPAGTRVRLAA